MPQPSAQVTAAEISRIAGVTRATVSNWRRRHDDFPAPSGGTESSPLYDLPAVRAWLDARGHTAAVSPLEELRTSLRLHPQGSGAAARLLLVLTTARRRPDELTALAELPDTDLAAHANDAIPTLAKTVPGAEASASRPMTPRRCGLWSGAYATTAAKPRWACWRNGSWRTAPPAAPTGPPPRSRISWPGWYRGRCPGFSTRPAAAERCSLRPPGGARRSCTARTACRSRPGAARWP